MTGGIRRIVCGTALAGAVLSFCASAAAACGAPAPERFAAVAPTGGRHDASLLSDAVLHFTNDARSCAGLAPLGADPALRRAAAIQAENMTRFGVFAHETPARGEKTLGDRLSAAGARYRSAGENVISGYFLIYEAGRSYRIIDEAACRFAYADGGAPLQRQTYASLGRRLVDRWMTSPGHRANLLSPEFSRHGAALSPTGDPALCGEFYLAQVFAG